MLLTTTTTTTTTKSRRDNLCLNLLNVFFCIFCLGALFTSYRAAESAHNRLLIVLSAFRCDDNGGRGLCMCACVVMAASSRSGSTQLRTCGGAQKVIYSAMLRDDAFIFILMEFFFATSTGQKGC